MTEPFVCPGDHKHAGSGTCYNEHRCRCVGCTELNRARKRHNYRLRAYGRPTSNLVDAAPARAHIEHLQAFGIGAKQIAAMAGISHAKVSHIMWGSAVSTPKRYRPPIPAKRISPDTETRILNVKPDVHQLRPNTSIPARGTQRRVQALVTLGWTHVELADRIGTSPEHLSYIVMHQDRVQVWTHLAAMRVFDELWNVPAPQATPADRITRRRMKKHARDRRWPPPLAWDDIDNDPEPPVVDDYDTVDDIAIELAIAGERVRLSHAEKLEGLRRMHPMKWSNLLIAEHLACDERTVVRLRRELDLPGWDQNEVLDRRAA